MNDQQTWNVNMAKNAINDDHDNGDGVQGDDGW